MPIPTEDPTTSMTLDEKIQPQTLSVPDTFDISQPVTPGHDMVINHLDGTQELGTGNEMLAVTAAEADSGQHVPLASVQVAPETDHRSVSDPEVNGPDQAALLAEKVALQAPAPKKTKAPAPAKTAPAPVEEPAEGTPAPEPVPEVEAPATPTSEEVAADTTASEA